MSAPASEAPRDPATMRRYLAMLVLGAALVLLSLAGGLFALHAADALPPPQFSNNLCMDEKLAAMRRSPPQAPRLLVVGSSVAWRHFNSPEAIRIDPAIRPYNAGLCGASVAQSGNVAEWLTRRLPSVRRVIMLTSPFDFETCRQGEAPGFNMMDADEFVFGQASSTLYYARYFDPVTLVRNSSGIRQDRSDIKSLNPLVQDSWGDGPSEPPLSRGLHYGPLIKLDPGCFQSLRRTADMLARRGIAFDVALMPMQPEWMRLYGKPNIQRLRSMTSEALRGTGAQLHIAFTQPSEKAYFDAMHLRWSSTAIFTRALLRQLRPAPAAQAADR